MKNEIILYRPNELAEHIEVKFNEDTAWLTQMQIAELFGTEIPAISKHINNIFKTGELEKSSTISILEIVRQEGTRTVKRKTTHYNLDMILSVGYRVNSLNATLFRRWATARLKDYLLKGYAINTRMDRIEVYHIGASLKDLGKKWFAFSKMNKESVASIINAISGLI